MSVLILAFLLGLVTGLRAFIGIAAITWAARSQWLDFEGSWAAFLGYRFTPIIVSALALGELIVDQLPSTPSRKVPKQFLPRIFFGAACGAAIGYGSEMIYTGMIAGILGSVAGTLGGARMRTLLARTFGRDMPAAFLEDALAVILAAFVISRTAA